MITFRMASLLASLVCLVLFGIFLVAPGAYVAGYGGPSDAGAAFLGRRTAPLFLGLGAVCWYLRTQEDKQVQQAVAAAMILTFLGIAVTGVWTYLEGAASRTILLAAAGELVLAFMFWDAVRKR